MFKCSVCGKLSKTRETSIRVLHCIRSQAYVNKDNISYGWEIVREGLAAPSHGHLLSHEAMLSDSRSGETRILPFPFFYEKTS